MVVVRLEKLDQLKNPITSGIDPTTFWLVTEHLDQLRYRVLCTTATTINNNNNNDILLF
jgi:hypothetical protein